MNTQLPYFVQTEYVAWEEKRKPENQGCNIKYGRKKGIVTKDDVVIDRFAIIF